MSFFIDALRKLPDGKVTGRRVGEFWTYDEAVAAAKHLIDSFLYHHLVEKAAQASPPRCSTKSTGCMASSR